MEKILVVLLLLCSASSTHSDSVEEGALDLHTVLREMSSELFSHRAKIEQLQTQNQEQADKLKEQTREVDSLKKQLQGRQVAFSASLLKSGSGTKETGPYNDPITLVFQNVVTNIGDAYNPHTGLFTAPVRGAYNFQFFITDGNSQLASGASLMKNQEYIYIAWNVHTGGFSSAGNGATLLLEVGDVVYVRQWPNTRIYDNHNHHTTFSGHLLYTM